MITQAIILSLSITAIYVVFERTMLLGWLRAPLATAIDESCIYVFQLILPKDQYYNSILKGKVASRYIQKPLWDCLPCMASVWTIILTLSFDVQLIFVVCGINILIDKYINE